MKMCNFSDRLKYDNSLLVLNDFGFELLVSWKVIF